MTIRHLSTAGIAVCTLLGLAACGGGTQTQQPVSDSGNAYPTSNPSTQTTKMTERQQDREVVTDKSKTVWSLFSNRSDPNVQIGVNKYLWNASLQVLDFLPIQSVDPFSGVIVTGYGTPPGGGRAYRATIYISDPALDARSLRVALESKGGAVTPDTVRAVEDAILTRARQLRVADSKL